MKLARIAASVQGVNICSSCFLKEATLWMASNWKISFTYSAIYLIVIFGGRRYMKDRPRLEIRPVLSAWNFMLAAFRYTVPLNLVI